MYIFNNFPDEIVSKIAYYILSYGTPSTQVIRDYMEKSMPRLPQQSTDNNKTLWRYQVYLSQYNFINNAPSLKNGYYQQSVYYDVVQALLASDDCQVKLQLNYRADVLNYTKTMAFKLNAIRISVIDYNVCTYGTPSAIIIKQHVKDMKKKRLIDNFNEY
jgi:hypothetical protein